MTPPSQCPEGRLPFAANPHPLPEGATLKGTWHASVTDGWWRVRPVVPADKFLSIAPIPTRNAGRGVAKNPRDSGELTRIGPCPLSYFIPYSPKVTASIGTPIANSDLPSAVLGRGTESSELSSQLLQIVGLPSPARDESCKSSSVHGVGDT